FRRREARRPRLPRFTPRFAHAISRVFQNPRQDLRAPGRMSKASLMQLTERRSEGLLRVYDVTVPASELQQQLNAKIEEVRPRVRINGFRPGKVPASHIRKVYGQSMMQDIINETVQRSTRESLQNIRAASEPALDLKSDMNQVVAGTQDLQFELSLEIMPDFEPVDLKT